MSLISPDTEAILLLTAHFGGERAEGLQPLAGGEYQSVARWLVTESMRPADLLGPDGRGRLAGQTEFDTARLGRLLDRGGRLGFELESWQARGLWVVGRGDSEYPAQWKKRLGGDAPPFLIGAGPKAALQPPIGLAMVGSRNVDETGGAFTRMLAARAASEQITVISGGASGVDELAMQAALEAGGLVVAVLAEGIARPSLRSEWRDAIAAGRLTLLSTATPATRFSARGALERNKLIYTLGDWTVVVSAAKGKGGTWSGATEALAAGGGPLFVRADDAAPAGNAALIARGARALRNGEIESTPRLRDLFDAPEDASTGNATNQPELPFG